MKKISLLLITALLILALIGYSKNNENSASSNDSQFVEYGVAGNITDITISENETILGTIKVEGSKDNGAIYDEAFVTISSSTKIYLNELVDFDALKVGMYVNVFFEGAVRESFPVQADAKQINIIPEDGN